MFPWIFRLLPDLMLFLGLHFEGGSSFPKQLSAKEEAECLKRLAAGDASARDELIIHNLRLVAYIVAKNYPETDSRDDLISIGTAGLIRAAETFDGTKGSRFSTYASKCIDNQIKMHFRKMKHRQTEVYLNEPIEQDGEGNSLTIADTLSSGVDVAHDAELSIDTERLYRYIEEELDERERSIICLRYGIPDKNGRARQPLTQREIAKSMGISRSYISRIEKRALEKLRARFF